VASTIGLIVLGVVVGGLIIWGEISDGFDSIKDIVEDFSEWREERRQRHQSE